MVLFVSPLTPRASLSEDLCVVVPRAELTLFPDEIVLHAQPPARGTLDDRCGRMRECLRDVVGKIFDVQHDLFVELGGELRGPLRAREQLDVANRREERALVLGRKRAVGPVDEAAQRDADVLPGIAEYDTCRRPCKRDETSGNRPALWAKAAREGKRAAVAAENESGGLVGVQTGVAGVVARYS